MAQRCSAVDDSLPLFSALFNYRHSEAESDSPLGEGVRLLSARERSNYPVGVSVDDLGSGFRLVVQASAEIGAQRVLGYLEQAVASLVAASEQAPERPVLELSVMPADERAHILDALSGGGPGTQPDALLVHTLFEEQVRRTPDAVALLCGNREVSYDALNRQANRIAHRLIALGVRPGDRVALCAERSAAAVAGILGALKSGAAYVPLDPEYPEDRLRFMLEDAAPAALLTEGRLTGILPGNMPVVLLGDAAPAEEPRDWEHDPDASARGLTARSLAYIIYTSGSTGRPKGVMVEHGNITWLFLNTKDKFHFDSKDTGVYFIHCHLTFPSGNFGSAFLWGRLVIVDKICTRSLVTSMLY
ncbi:MAG: Linear gramicidin synthase subunit D [Candidatus Erwinia impunctatus]|nr:Linear gramicidin synthase subunit D [Culicoides impunctatus]